MKFQVKTVCLTIVAFIGLTSMAFGRTIQEKTMFYGEKITGLNVSSVFDVAVIKGDDNYLKLEYDPFFEGRIEAKITNGILELRLLKGNKYDTNLSKMLLNAIVCVSDLSQVTASGSVDIHFVGEYSPKSITMTISGSSDILGLHCTTEKFNLISSGSSDVKDFVITADETAITSSGSSDIVNFELKGDNAKINLSGTSDLKNSVFEVGTMVINASGSSDIENVQCVGKDCSMVLIGSSDFENSTLLVENFKMEISGASSCSVSGKAKTALVVATSSASVSMKNVEIENLTTDLSGGSNGSFKVNGKLNFEVSSSSDLHIYGSPHIERSVSTGGSSVKYN